MVLKLGTLRLDRQVLSLTRYNIGDYTIRKRSHVLRNRKKLALRIARIRGQLDSVTCALDGQAECGEVLRLIASARGAKNGLMAEVLEDHIRSHAFRGARTGSEDAEAADDLVSVVRSYLK